MLISMQPHTSQPSHQHLCSFFLLIRPPPRSTLFPYTTLFRSNTRPSSSSTSPSWRSPRVCACRINAISRSGTPAWRKGCPIDRKSTRLNSSHGYISYAVFCLKKKNNKREYHSDEIESQRHYRL